MIKNVASRKYERNHVFLILSSTLYVFFSHTKVVSGVLNVHLAFFLLLGCTLIILYIKYFPSIKIDTVNQLWIAYGFVLLLNMLTTPYVVEGRLYFFFHSLMIVLLVFLRSTVKWEKHFAKLLFIFSGIHSVCIVLQYVFPNTIMRINKVLLTDYSYTLAQSAITMNYYSGIANQAAAAGMFAVIFCAIVFCKLLTTKKKNGKLLIALLVGIVALLLTQKRSFFVASIFAAYFIMIIYNNKEMNKRVIRLVRNSTLAALGGWLVFIIAPSTQNVVWRFFQDRGLFASRETMYNTMMEWSVNSRLWGEGIGAAQTTFGFGGHNIYIQVLAETGIVGFIIFYIALFALVISNIKKCRLYVKNNPTEREVHGVLLLSLYMQVIFILYGVSGNPIYDYIFFILLIFFLSIPSAVIRSTTYSTLNSFKQ